MGHLSRADSTEDLSDIRRAINRILYTQEIIVSGLTDLNTNLATLQAEITTFLADMATALGNEDSDAAVEQAAQLVAQMTASLQGADPVTGTATAATAPASTSSDDSTASTPAS
jgi:hypothetical protein